MKEEGCKLMKQVLKVLSRKVAEERIPVLRLELDYELATLYEAMTEKNEEKMIKCKKKLEKLRQEMIELELF